MSGRDLIRKVRSSSPEIRAILMSGYDKEQSTFELTPNVEFLPKPFEPRELLAMLGTCSGAGAQALR